MSHRYGTPVKARKGADRNDISKFWGDATWRYRFTRHMGGNNLGFADGHAAWWPADAMIAAANANPQQLEPVDRQSLPGNSAGRQRNSRSVHRGGGALRETPPPPPTELHRKQQYGDIPPDDLPSPERDSRPRVVTFESSRDP